MSGKIEEPPFLEKSRRVCKILLIYESEDVLMTLQNIHETIQKELEKYQGKFSYVISHNDQKIEHNAAVMMTAASTIKIPLAIEVLRQCEEGHMHLGTMITIGKKDVVGGAGVIQSLDVTALSLKDLLSLMIVVSDNTATNLVIELLGLEKIKKGYKRIGLSSTTLNRKMMDFESLQKGIDNLICAEDLHHCLRTIEDNSYLRKESKQMMLMMLSK